MMFRLLVLSFLTTLLLIPFFVIILVSAQLNPASYKITSTTPTMSSKEAEFPSVGGFYSSLFDERFNFSYYISDMGLGPAGNRLCKMYLGDLSRTEEETKLIECLNPRILPPSAAGSMSTTLALYRGAQDPDTNLAFYSNLGTLGICIFSIAPSNFSFIRCIDSYLGNSTAFSKQLIAFIYDRQNKFGYTGIQNYYSGRNPASVCQYELNGGTNVFAFKTCVDVSSFNFSSLSTSTVLAGFDTAVIDQTTYKGYFGSDSYSDSFVCRYSLTSPSNQQQNFGLDTCIFLSGVSRFMNAIIDTQNNVAIFASFTAGRLCKIDTGLTSFGLLSITNLGGYFSSGTTMFVDPANMKLYLAKHSIYRYRYDRTTSTMPVENTFPLNYSSEDDGGCTDCPCRAAVYRHDSESNVLIGYFSPERTQKPWMNIINMSPNLPQYQPVARVDFPPNVEYLKTSAYSAKNRFVYYISGFFSSTVVTRFKKVTDPSTGAPSLLFDKYVFVRGTFVRDTLMLDDVNDWLFTGPCRFKISTTNFSFDWCLNSSEMSNTNWMGCVLDSQNGIIYCGTYDGYNTYEKGTKFCKIDVANNKFSFSKCINLTAPGTGVSDKSLVLDTTNMFVYYFLAAADRKLGQSIVKIDVRHPAFSVVDTITVNQSAPLSNTVVTVFLIDVVNSFLYYATSKLGNNDENKDIYAMVAINIDPTNFSFHAYVNETYKIRVNEDSFSTTGGNSVIDGKYGFFASEDAGELAWWLLTPTSMRWLQSGDAGGVNIGCGNLVGGMFDRENYAFYFGARNSDPRICTAVLKPDITTTTTFLTSATTSTSSAIPTTLTTTLTDEATTTTTTTAFSSSVSTTTTTTTSSSSTPQKNKSRTKSFTETKTQRPPIVSAAPLLSPEVAALRLTAELFSTASSITSMFVITSPSVSTSAVQTRAVLGGVNKIMDGNCGVTTEDLQSPPDLSSSPLQMNLGYPENGGFLSGLVIGNSIVLVAVFVICFIGYSILRKACGSENEEEEDEDEGSSQGDKKEKEKKTRGTKHLIKKKNNNKRSLGQLIKDSKAVYFTFLFMMLIIDPMVSSTAILFVVKDPETGENIVTPATKGYCCVITLLLVSLLSGLFYQFLFARNPKLEVFLTETSSDFEQSNSSGNPFKKIVKILFGTEGEWTFPDEGEKVVVDLTTGKRATREQEKKFLNLQNVAQSSLSQDSNKKSKNNKEKDKGKKASSSEQQKSSTTFEMHQVTEQETKTFTVVGYFLEPYTARFPTFVCIDIGQIIFLSLCKVVGSVSNNCTAQGCTLVLVILLHTTLSIVYRPNQERILQLCVPLLGILQIILIIWALVAESQQQQQTVVVVDDNTAFAALSLTVVILQGVVTVLSLFAFVAPALEGLLRACSMNDERRKNKKSSKTPSTKRSFPLTKEDENVELMECLVPTDSKKNFSKKRNSSSSSSSASPSSRRASTTTSTTTTIANTTSIEIPAETLSKSKNEKKENKRSSSSSLSPSIAKNQEDQHQSRRSSSKGGAHQNRSTRSTTLESLFSPPGGDTSSRSSKHYKNLDDDLLLFGKSSSPRRKSKSDEEQVVASPAAKSSSSGKLSASKTKIEKSLPTEKTSSRRHSSTKFEI